MPEPLSPERLIEIRERAANATPGPWGVGNRTEIALDVDQTYTELDVDQVVD